MTRLRSPARPAATLLFASLLSGAAGAARADGHTVDLAFEREAGEVVHERSIAYLHLRETLRPDQTVGLEPAFTLEVLTRREYREKGDALEVRTSVESVSVNVAPARGGETFEGGEDLIVGLLLAHGKPPHAIDGSGAVTDVRADDAWREGLERALGALAVEGAAREIERRRLGPRLERAMDEADLAALVHRGRLNYPALDGLELVHDVPSERPVALQGSPEEAADAHPVVYLGTLACHDGAEAPDCALIRQDRPPGDGTSGTDAVLLRLEAAGLREHRVEFLTDLDPGEGREPFRNYAIARTARGPEPDEAALAIERPDFGEKFATPSRSAGWEDFLEHGGRVVKGLAVHSHSFCRSDRQSEDAEKREGSRHCARLARAYTSERLLGLLNHIEDEVAGVDPDTLEEGHLLAQTHQVLRNRIPFLVEERKRRLVEEASGLDDAERAGRLREFLDGLLADAPEISERERAWRAKLREHYAALDDAALLGEPAALPER